MAVKTYMAKKDEVQAKWLLVDATDKVVGRLAADLAVILQGKHRPQYTPHVDTGDFVIVVNAEKVKHTGANKTAQRVFKRYTHHPGGYKEISTQEMLATHPERVLIEAVRRMLPKTRLGRSMLQKLKVYAGPNHNHQAQQPEVLAM